MPVRKPENIDDIPLGVVASNGKLVGFDAGTRKRVYISQKNMKRPTFLYIPNPKNRNYRAEVKGWLLTIMRNKPTKPGFNYTKLKPTAREMDFLNSIKRRVDSRINRYGPAISAKDMWKRGIKKMGWMAGLAATYED